MSQRRSPGVFVPGPGPNPGGSFPPVITAANPPDGTQGSPYTYTLQATGSSPKTWTVRAGTLPSGLSLSSVGVISGTPLTVQTPSATVRVTNADGFAEASFDIGITAAPQPGQGQKIYSWQGIVWMDALIGGVSGLSLQTFKDYGFDGHVQSLGSPGFPFPAWLRQEFNYVAGLGDLFLAFNLADLLTAPGVPQNQSEWNAKISILSGLIGEAGLCGARGIGMDPEPYNATISHGLGWEMNGSATASLFYNNGVTMGNMIISAGLNPAEGIQFYLASDTSWDTSAMHDIQVNAGQPSSVYSNSGFPHFVHGLLDAGCKVNLLDASVHCSIQQVGCGGDAFCAIQKDVNQVKPEFPGPPTARCNFMIWPDCNEGSNPRQKPYEEIAWMVRASMAYGTGPLSVYSHSAPYGGNETPPPGQYGPDYWRTVVLPAILAGKTS
jgi:hypothetical protein